MVAVQGYYDGITIRPMEKFDAKRNQRVIITIMDDYIESGTSEEKAGIRGIISRHANPSLIEKEKGAWERAMVENHGNA